MKNNEVTNEELARLISKGFEESERKTDKKIEDLAQMVKIGFDEMGDKFQQVDKRLDHLETNYKRLEIGQEDIKLRLDNVAYRFELNDLQNRVMVLEKKIR